MHNKNVNFAVSIFELIVVTIVMAFVITIIVPQKSALQSEKIVSAAVDSASQSKEKSKNTSP